MRRCPWRSFINRPAAPADAHAVLTCALEGFSPAPEFPEIEQAEVLAALAETDEVKNAAAARQRRLKLQTAYGQAMIWSKGFGSEETKTAFLRAQELAAGIDNAAEQFTILYGLWVGYLSRGEFAVGRETAEAFRREAEAAARIMETVIAGRILGLTCLWQGDFTQSQVNLLQALQLYDLKVSIARPNSTLASIRALARQPTSLTRIGSSVRSDGHAR